MKLSDINKISEYYEEIGGTYFKKETSKEVVQLINQLIESKQRVRLFYGDSVTGRDWCRRYDTIGYIGRTMGEIPRPVLLKEKQCIDGYGIEEQNIVKLTIKKKNAYCHPGYHINLRYKKQEGFYYLFLNDDNKPLFKSESGIEAKREYKIYLGELEK